MIHVRDLHKSFGTTPVLRGVDLSVETGEVVAVTGPSGSGKSTLLRCLNLLEVPQRGEIRIGDATVTLDGHAPSRAATAQVRSRSAMVFQHVNLFRNRTALQNVTDAMRLHTRADRAAARDAGLELLASVGIGADIAGQFPVTLSGGQAQRVGIARALAVDPSVLLFDEPTSALDPELVGEVLGVIRALAARGRTMVIVTHEMGFAAEVADRVMFMDGGVVVEEGPARQVLGAPSHERTRRFLQQVGTQREGTHPEGTQPGSTAAEPGARWPRKAAS